MFQLAEHLGQPLSVILQMSTDEYYHWFTYLRLKAEEIAQHDTRNHNAPKVRNNSRNRRR
jgi:hypothetical protein